MHRFDIDWAQSRLVQVVCPCGFLGPARRPEADGDPVRLRADYDSHLSITGVPTTALR